MIVSPPIRRTLLLLAAGLLLVGAGCSERVEFRTNEAYLITQEFQVAKLEGDYRNQIKQNLKDVLTTLFGTPNEPRLPTVPDLDLSSMMELAKLESAAGPVSSDKFGRPQGLYREHCAHCHGITGDGRGPTAAFLNPYPRDYRRGLFKFKSTPGALPPTHDDLMRILVEGIPGTAMPSFRLLPKDELESLVQYVRYLSIRGEVERALIAEAVNLSPGELLVDASSESAKEQADYVLELVAEVAAKWAEADASATPVPAPPEDFESPESIARGRELFFGATANCIKCHGETALGDGVLNDYDEWTKELAPTDTERLAAYVSANAVLDPRPIRPRNLRLNVFRGGRRPVDLYWRIHNGIAGTPMPAAAMKPDDASEDDPRLTTDDLWHIIAYVRNLPYDDLSQPSATPAALQRDRQ